MRVAAVILLALGACVVTLAGVSASTSGVEVTSLPVGMRLVFLATSAALIFSGVFVFFHAPEFSERLFIRSLGLSRDEKKQALRYDLKKAIPFKHRKMNRGVACSAYRVTLRGHAEGVKLFSRIASGALVETDAAQLFGPQLDEFVYVFSQSVEQMDDRDADALLALVRKNMATPEDVIMYLGELKSVSATIWALREGVPLEYARALP